MHTWSKQRSSSLEESVSLFLSSLHVKVKHLIFVVIKLLMLQLSSVVQVLCLAYIFGTAVNFPLSILLPVHRASPILSTSSEL